MEQTNQKPLQKEKKPRSLGRTAGLIAGIAVGVLAAAYIAVCAAAAAGGTTLRGTQVLGVDVGGLTAQQVRDKWQREGDAACRKETIDLTLEDQVIGTVNLTELGVSVTPQEAAQAAWNAAHGGNFFVNGYHLIRSWFGDTQAQVQWDLDAGQLSQRAESLSRELSRDPVDGAYRMEEGKGDGFYVIKAADGRTIDRDKLARALHQAVTARCMDPIPCVSTTTQGKPLDLAALEQEIGGQGKNASYDRSTGQVVEGPHRRHLRRGRGRKAGGGRPARPGDRHPRPDHLSHRHQGGAGEGAVPRRAGTVHLLCLRHQRPDFQRPQGRREHQRLRGQQRREFQL